MDEYDLDEIVRLPGHGDLSLRAAVKQVMALPPEQRHLAIVYRDEGKEPGIYDISHIERIAGETAPGRQE